jgi:TonB-dependent SusC/RagA subfamily outer membrane receptor
MRKFSLLLVILVFIGLQVVSAQTRTITGIVISGDDGSSVPGVTIIVKESTLGTITDMDGKFTLKVPESAKALLVSFVGMTSMEVPLTAAMEYRIVMQSENVKVDEIVVTAMGITSAKKSLGYSVQKVGGDVLAAKPNSDIVNSLAGRTSGVQITSSAGDAGASTYMTIRGASSITGNNQPLFVVNGMPIISGGGSGGVDGVTTSSRSIDLNPEDIESITVLKGGAATALYGLRAANGVLMITTKSGKNLQSRKIEFHTSVGFPGVRKSLISSTTATQPTNGIRKANWLKKEKGMEPLPSITTLMNFSGPG